MTHPNLSTALGHVVVDQLVAEGVERFFVSPGSRSAPLAIAAAQREDVDTVVVIDERSAGFMALGSGKAGGLAALICTSGTALANYMPAVVEASMSGTSMVVVTADRPRHLIGTGVNQTIDQAHFYGGWVRAFAALETSRSESANREWRTTVHTVTRASRVGIPGPVHLNVAFDEPLSPVTHDGRTEGTIFEHPTPRLSFDPIEPSGELGKLSSLSLEPGRGLVVVGDGEYDRGGLLRAAHDLKWPVLATAQSGLRGRRVVSSYRQILRDGVEPALRPEVVLAVGSLGPDPTLEKLVESADIRVRVDRWGRSIDPGKNATEVMRADPVALLESLSGNDDPDWLNTWLGAEDAAAEQIAAMLSADDQLTGARIVDAMNQVAPSLLFAGSSLPIREIDAHLRTESAVVANRGVSGIDGSISTAVGAAMAARTDTVAFIGDIAAFHDSNGLLVDPGQVSLVLVVMDNRGGGLFDELPQRSHAPEFERLFITDPKRDLAALAHLHDVPLARVRTRTELVAAITQQSGRGGISMIQAVVDREFDLAQRVS